NETSSSAARIAQTLSKAEVRTKFPWQASISRSRNSRSAAVRLAAASPASRRRSARLRSLSLNRALMSGGIRLPASLGGGPSVSTLQDEGSTAQASSAANQTASSSGSGGTGPGCSGGL